MICSGLWCRIVWLMFTDVLERDALAFWITFRSWRWNIGKLLLDCTPSLPTRQCSWQSQWSEQSLLNPLYKDKRYICLFCLYVRNKYLHLTMEKKKYHLSSQIIHRTWEISLTIVYFKRLLVLDEWHFQGRGIHAICHHFKQKPIFQIIIIELFQIQEPSRLKWKTY